MDTYSLNNIILGTGNYYNIKKGNTVSITGDGGNAWGYFGNSYKKLSPRLITYKHYIEKYNELFKLKQETSNSKEYYILKKQIEDDYIKSYYETRLKNLNIPELFCVLKSKFGKNIILLCHENIDEFCHRRLLADYIELKTGIFIPEITVDNNGAIKKINPIRYKKRLSSVINN